MAPPPRTPGRYHSSSAPTETAAASAAAPKNAASTSASAPGVRVASRASGESGAATRHLWSGPEIAQHADDAPADLDAVRLQQEGGDLGIRGLQPHPPLLQVDPLERRPLAVQEGDHDL